MDKLAGGCLLPLEQPKHEGAIGCADPCFTYWLPVPFACLPHVPEAQGSLPIVALLLYARGDGSLTYVPSLSHYRCEPRDQGGTDAQRGPARDLRPRAGNGRACAQARQEATRTAELLDRSVTQTGQRQLTGHSSTCQSSVRGRS